MPGVNISNPISHRRAADLIERFATVRAAVIGDLMLDVFSYGHSDRLSPEAPVPVMLVSEERFMPGGAANVAVNMTHLGGSVNVYGAIANDASGEALYDALKKEGNDVDGIVRAAEYATTEKRRIVLHGNHYVRVDRERREVPLEALGAIRDAFMERVHEFDVLVVSDYAKGVYTEDFARTIVQSARKRNIPIVVDTKPARESWYEGATLFTPNVHEARAMTDSEHIDDAGKMLCDRLLCAILITRGADGMTLYENGEATHISAVEKDVVDVSGAGDTVTATCALALAAGATMGEAAQLASVAAGIAVSRPGTSSLTRGDLLARFENGS